jgi:small subunit ribosomal protein S6
MPIATYETLFLLDPTKVSSDAEGVKNQLHHILERHAAKIEISRPWDYNHKLSYPISKQKKGAFHIIYYTMESTKQKELEADFKLAPETILRHMTLKIDPKWNEIVMGVAREDGGNGFAVRGMQDETAVQTDPSAIGGEMGGGEGDFAGAGAGGPRRGGRRFDGPEKPE